MQDFLKGQQNELRQVKIRDLAFESFPYEINGESFIWKHIYSGKQLLNGVDFNLKYVKGLDRDEQKINFLFQSRQLVFIFGGNLVGYNPNKKIYRRITSVSKVERVSVFSDKNTQKQYILVLESRKNQKRRLFVYDCVRKSVISHYAIKQSIDRISSIFITGSFQKIVGFIVNNQQGCVVHYTVLKQNYIHQNIMDEWEQFLQKNINFNIKETKSSNFNMVLFANETNSLYELKFFMDQGRRVGLRVSRIIQLKVYDQIIQYQMNQTILVIRTNHSIDIYSIADEYRLLFNYKFHNLFEERSLHQIDQMVLNDNNLIIFHETSQISILNYSINGLRLLSTNKFPDQTLNKIIKVFSNSFNNQIIIVTEHEKVQYLLKTKSFRRLLKRQSSIVEDSDNERIKHLEITTYAVSSFISKNPIDRIVFGQDNYKNILIAPWVDQYFIQTENKIIGKKWESKFDPIKCSCIHPTGQYILIGFADCYKIYLATIEGLQNTYMGDGVKDCQAVAYSMYGDEFAIASTNSITIYNAYSFCKKQFIQLQLGIQIQSLIFLKDSLLCTTKNKKISLFSFYHDYKEIFSYSPKNYLTFTNDEPINSIFYDRKLDLVIFSHFKKIYFINAKEEFNEIGQYDFDNITCIVHSQLLDTLFLGTQNGDIHAFPWPNNPANITQKIPVYHCHDGHVKTIKVTSNHKYLLTLGSNGSFYQLDIEYVSQMKKLKTHEMIIQKKGYLATVGGLMDEKRICHYTSFQWNIQMEEIRKLEEEVMISCFISPQEREKQKNSMIDNINQEKDILTDQCKNVFNLLQTQSIDIKSKICKLKRQILSNKRDYQVNVHQANTLFQSQLISINSKREQIQNNYNKKFLSLRQQIENRKEKFKQQIEKLEQHYKMVLGSKDFENSLIKQQLREFKTQYQELNEIEKQKELFKERKIKKYEEQIAKLTSRNGQFVCGNCKLEKEISMKKRKIQETKEITLNTIQNIKNIQKKQPKKNEQIENIHLGSIEKRYIQMNKRLISGQKSIAINLTLHEKESSIVILLQRTLQNTEKQIQKIVENIFVEKKLKKDLDERLIGINNKINSLLGKAKNSQRINIAHKNAYKDLTYKVHFYLDDAIPKINLQKKTQIRLSQNDKETRVILSENRYSQNKNVQKKIIEKIMKEEKLFKLIKNQKKFYQTCRKKMNINSQDLVETYNILNYENTNLAHKLQNQEGCKRNIKRQIKHQIVHRQNSPTPFQQYISRKMVGRRVKTLPGVEGKAG